MLEQIAWNEFLAEHRDSLHVVITDDTIAALHGDKLVRSLREAGFKTQFIILPEGERAKNLASFSRAALATVKAGVDQDSLVFSLGGGAVSNVAGLVAAAVLRGIGLVHVPTTLMAQLDASVDFKQAINGPMAKNLFGACHSPKLVVIDTSLLVTNQIRHIRDGLAECAKHALTEDNNLFLCLQNSARRWFDPEFLDYIVLQTVKLKVGALLRVLRCDDGDGVLQYGHLIGHAIEASQCGLTHGEAISVGMCCIADIAHKRGIAEGDTRELHDSLFAHIGLPTTLSRDANLGRIIQAARYDKYRKGGRFRSVMVRSAGQLVREPSGASMHIIEEEEIERALTDRKGRC